MSKKMFPLLLMGGAAVAAIAMGKKKGKKSLADELPPPEDLPGVADDIPAGPRTLEEHAIAKGGDLMIIKDSSGAPSKVMQLNGVMYMMPIDSKGQISQMVEFEELVKYPQALNAGLWNGASSKQFGDFGWAADIVDGHREVLKFVVEKLKSDDIEDFQNKWNSKHNDSLRNDGVIDMKTLEAINKSK
jgi:hypothetical protein